MSSLSLRINIVKLGSVKTLKVRPARPHGVRRPALIPHAAPGPRARSLSSLPPLQFAGSMSVAEVCKDIREKLGEETGGSDHGLFWPDTGKWLDPRRTLDYYDLKSGVRRRAVTCSCAPAAPELRR